MDIAKIRKKALSKEAAQEKPAEKLQEKPVPTSAEDEKEQGAVEESVAPPEEISENATAGDR